MTVSTEISSNKYTGNGLTTDFDYKFRIFKANQLSVITSDADGDNVVTLRLGTDYTVTGANKSAGGKVILTKPLANGNKISIARDIPITQETSFRNQSKFFAETHEDAFDYLTMIVQRIWGSLGSLYLKRPNILSNWFDAKGYRIANLGKPKRDSDAVDFGTMKDAISSQNKRSLRVDDMDIAALPKASDRSGNVLTFDKDGRPIVIAPATGSAVDVLNKLSNPEGAGMIGVESGESVQESINNITLDSEAAMTLFPSSLMSFSEKRMAIEVINSDPNNIGQINTYRKTKHGWWLRERMVTGSYSGGTSLPNNGCPVWRLGQSFIAPHLLTMKSTLSAKSDESIGSYSMIPRQFINGNNKNSVKFHQIQGGGTGALFVEFETNTKSNYINVLLAGTASTNSAIKAEVMLGDKILSTETVDSTTNSASLSTFIYQLKNPRPGESLKVRFTTTGNAWAYIAGINAIFDTDISDDIDTINFAIYNQNYLIRPTQTGAMCYVFKEQESGLFGGESHGGETPSLQKVIVDNKEATLENNTMFSCESFRVIQETQIKWSETKKIDCYTEHRFNSDGTHEFIGSFVPTKGFKVSTAYCPMFTVNSTYYRKIKLPEFVNMSNFANGATVDIRYPINQFEIQGSDGLYTAGIMWSSSLKNNGIQRTFVNPYGDYSTKMYAGPAIDKVINLEKFTIHQMRYYL